MAPTTPITFKGKLVWTGLILFGAGWMFVLGIMVGRGTAPIPKMLPHFEKDIKQNKSVGASETNDSAQKQDLAYPEVLKNPIPRKPITPVERKSTRPKPPKPKVAQVKPTPPAPSTGRKQTVASKPVESKPPAPAASPKKSEKQPTGQSNPVSGRYTVQVAAVKNVQSAEKLVQDLRSKGFKAYQIRSQSDNKAVWYRVRVGAFSSRDAAEKALSGLNKKNVKGIVLQVP